MLDRVQARRVPFLLSAALLASFWLGPQAYASEGAEGLSKGTSVPRFLLPVVNKEAFKESRRWGPEKWAASGKQPKKLVIMSFFATYCEPCKREMPELVRLYSEYKDQGLGVMLVSIDKGMAKRKELAEIAKANQVPFPVLHDAFQVVARRYKAEKLPYMLMVGPDGVIQVVHVGYTDELKAALENQVRGLLGLSKKSETSAEVTSQTPPDTATKEPEKGAVEDADSMNTAKAVTTEKKVKKKKRKKRRKKRRKKKRKSKTDES